jgi:hypothetical protein
MSNLVLFFTFEYVDSQQIITNYSHVSSIESAGIFVSIVKTCSCQFVCASANHLPSISGIPLNGVTIHCPWVYFLPFPMQNILIAVLLPSNKDMMQNQVSSAKK